MSWHVIAEAIGWLSVAPLSIYTTYGLVFVPLVQWVVLRSYLRRRLAFRDYVAADTGPPAPRKLQARDLLDLPCVILSLLPIAVFVLPYLNWIAVTIPGALVPVFAGWWWLRLRAKGVQSAHVYLWLALVTPALAWSLAMLLHADSYAWQDAEFGDFAIPWYTSADLIGGRIGIAIGLMAYVALSVVAVIAARIPTGQRVADVATLATVPLAVQMWMSVPFGPVYLIWMMSMLGFWVALRQAEVDPRGPETTLKQLAQFLRLRAAGKTAVAPGHRDLVAQFLTASALSATVLLALRSAPPDSVASPIASWSTLALIGLGAYLFARRTVAPAVALNLALGSQVTAVMAATLLSAGIWLSSGDDLSASYSSGLGISLIVAQALVLVVSVAFGWVVFTLRDGMRRFGALLMGWSWPVALLFAINIHGFDPSPRELADFYAPAQVASVAIGMTLWLAVMWRTYGIERSHGAYAAAAASPAAHAGEPASRDQGVPESATAEA